MLILLTAEHDLPKKNFLPTLIISNEKFHSSISAARIESKPDVEFVTRACRWHDCLINTCPLVHKHEFSGVCGAPVVYLQLKLLTNHRLIIHSQEVSRLSSNNLKKKSKFKDGTFQAERVLPMYI